MKRNIFIFWIGVLFLTWEIQSPIGRIGIKFIQAEKLRGLENIPSQRPSLIPIAPGLSTSSSSHWIESPETIVITWNHDPEIDNKSIMKPIAKITANEAIVVFLDRTKSEEERSSSAVVTFNVQSRPNCVVSVCGEAENWLRWASEQCFDLRVINKNGETGDFSAAYSADRPVAKRLYLKFDDTNIIDGSVCEYTILSGTRMTQ